ncbi:MAG: HAMP domain-containing sensor histidine kinase [Enhygromyxa sp.]
MSPPPTSPPPTSPSPTSRLAIEQRVLAMLALLGMVHAALFALWTALALEPEDLAILASVTELGALLGITLAAIVACMLHVTLRMPELRWGAAGGPGPWPLTLLGLPALLLWPLLVWRERRATQRERELHEVELGFRQLLAVPRIAATSFAIWLGVATILALSLIARFAAIDARTLGLLLALTLASLVPLVSLATSRIRAMLVPEYLSAPRPDPLALPRRRSLALRLGGPAGLALLGVVAVPVLAGQLWTERVDESERRERAQQEAQTLIQWAEAGDFDMARAFVGDNPQHGLVTNELRLGVMPGAIGPQRGFVDVDGDGTRDHYIAQGPTGALASAAVLEPLEPNTAVSIASVALGLVAGLASLVLLLRDVERDLGRASRQVGAVADGEIPEPMAINTFATAELRGLVAAIDRLVGRITDANVAKYVLIEKGQEADRLKSQFLANMSHDLRSPLNSVLGFSELLMTGIEGELSASQRERVGTIHRTGKDLLQQIDDILDTAKIEAGRMELHREPTPPATLISRAIQRARVRLDRPIEFDTTFAPGLPPAFVDPYRSAQALENVLLFAAEGLRQGTIEISCDARSEGQAVTRDGREAGREIVIRIVSPRALVPLAELEQARRGFFRLPGHTGLGLGLPIATSILEQQNGSLQIEDGTSSSLGGRAAMGFELRMPALTARRVPRTRVRPGSVSE